MLKSSTMVFVSKGVLGCIYRAALTPSMNKLKMLTYRKHLLSIKLEYNFLSRAEK
jgi:hypothetical protein